MSYTTLYKVPASGPLEEAGEFRNSWRFAAHIWNALSRKYLGRELALFSDAGARAVWNLWKDERVSQAERVTLLCTFDHAMVEKEFLPEVARAFEEFAAEHEPGSLREQAGAIRALAGDPECSGCCWQVTSVADDLWRIYDEDRQTRRLFDLSRDYVAGAARTESERGDNRFPPEPVWVGDVSARWKEIARDAESGNRP
jgi:hypothetical protein